MSQPSDQNSTERFSNLAEVYSRCRPNYPPAAIDFVLQRCSLTPGNRLVDVGSGTGISSRLFAQRGLIVVGIEPNEAMRTEAENTTGSNSELQVSYQQGTAESTGLPEATCDAILAAQAFHWFEPTPTLREFLRILKPGGWLVLMWNERDESDSFTREYGEVIRQFPNSPQIESMRSGAGDVLLEFPEFHDATRDTFPNQQVLDEEGMIGRAFSASYAPRDPETVAIVTERFREIFQTHQKDEAVAIQYETSVYTAQARK